ncbi:MAG: hypothetical protein OEZ43_02380 [Gammaproteobacteria bacterium]|nr:hypothetical protein [Gammaproteobacteria bacterium]
MAITLIEDKPKQQLFEEAATDPLLSAVSQYDEVEAFLSRLQHSTIELSDLIHKEFETRRVRSLSRLSALKQAIQETHDTLAGQFGKLLEMSTVDKYVLRSTFARMEKTLIRLSREVHPYLTSVLEPLAPNHGVINTLMSQVLAAYYRAVSDAPENLVSVVDYYTLAIIREGKSVVEAFIEEFESTTIDRTHSRFNLSSYRRLRKHFYHRLRILELPLAQMTKKQFLDHRNDLTEQLTLQHEQIHHQLSGNLDVTWRTIRFSLEEVLAELDDILDDTIDMTTTSLNSRLSEPQQILLDGLQKAYDSFEEIGEQYFNFFNHVEALLEDDSNSCLQALRAQVQRILTFRESPPSRSNPLRFKSAILWAKINRIFDLNIDDINRGNRHIFSVARGGVKQALRHLQRESYDQNTLLRMSELPPISEIFGAERNLPPIYRRLFSSKPLVTLDMVVWREEPISQFMEIFYRWESGHECSISICGQEGSGRNTLLNVLEGELESLIVRQRVEITERLRSQADIIRMFQNWFKIEEDVESLDELISLLHQQPKQVVFVEGSHNLLLRTIGLRNAPHAMMYVILATRSQFLWVMSFKQYPWQRLSYLFDIQRYFTHRISIDFGSDVEIRDAILLRQRCSQYPVVFTAGSVRRTVIKRTVSRLGEESARAQKILTDLYFEELFQISGKNMKAAMYFWLYSIKYDATNKRILVIRSPRVEFGFIQDLDRLYLFTLGEIIYHGELSVTEHAEIFNLNTFVSRSRLEYLRHIRLLEALRYGRNKLPSSYGINPVFYQPLVSILSAQHILY